MKKNKEQKIKNKADKKQIITRVLACVMLVLMVLASCSTCIYYVVSSIQK